MIDQLEKHHIGIIITNDQKVTLEKRGLVFHNDVIQGAHISFEMDNELGMYREYIVQEGRVANVNPGFYHFCYNIPDLEMMKTTENFIKNKKLGFPITKWENAKADECGSVKFYFLKNLGVVEFNIDFNLDL
jgi:hypothetical protein